MICVGIEMRRKKDSIVIILPGRRCNVFMKTKKHKSNKTLRRKNHVFLKMLKTPLRHEVSNAEPPWLYQYIRNYPIGQK